VLRVTPELERSHDLVMQVAGSAGLAAPGGSLTPRARALAVQMADLASQMWRQAADAWYQRDRTAAAALAGRGQEMDEMHASLAAELATGQATAPVTMEAALVAHCYQRLGAHAVNIARRVTYLAGPTARELEDNRQLSRSACTEERLCRQIHRAWTDILGESLQRLVRIR
jgi:phosphate transport system protein